MHKNGGNPRVDGAEVSDVMSDVCGLLRCDVTGGIPCGVSGLYKRGLLLIIPHTKRNNKFNRSRGSPKRKGEIKRR